MADCLPLTVNIQNSNMALLELSGIVVFVVILVIVVIPVHF